MKKNRRTLRGKIIKKSGAQTIKVEVSTKHPHPIYRKIVKRHARHMAHCPNLDAVEIGDEVIIGEMKPVSKKKCWEFLGKVE